MRRCTTVLLLSFVSPITAFQTPLLHRTTRQSPTSLSVLRRPRWIDESTNEELMQLENSAESESQFPAGMMDLTKLLGPTTENTSTDLVVDAESSTELSPSTLAVPVVGAIALLVTAVAQNLGITLHDVTSTATAFTQDPSGTLQTVIDGIQAMGPAAPLYFALFYVLCEMVAVPATPLALSAGYLFGLPQGTAVVLGAGTIAACIGFGVGRTLLRSWVEGILGDNPQLQTMDRAIGKEGFKLLVLLRLSPIFPFALANYVYGASSVSFPAFFWGTLLGFAPGTAAYVYTGMVGKEILLGDGAQPWYIYAGGLTILAGLLKLVTDVATGIVEALDEEEDVVVQ